MILTRTLRAFVCRLLVGLVLFSQAAMVAYACSGPAIGVPLEVAVADALIPACDHLDPQTPNLCLEHCRAGQQSADTAPAPVVHAALPMLLYSLPLEPAYTPGSGRRFPAPDASLAAAPPPPHAILHCVFRI